nr:type 1 fimbriae anchoring protein FimD [Raoultella sp. NCTC 9187]
MTHARSVLADDRPYSGDSVRLRYSKRLNDIGTRFNFYSLRYSTQGFYTLSDTAYKGMTGGTAKQVTGADGAVTTSYENLYNLHMSRKAKNQLLLSQPMGRFGSLSLSWDRQTYWRTANRTQSMPVCVERDGPQRLRRRERSAQHQPVR